MLTEKLVGSIGAGVSGPGNSPGQGTPASARPEDVARFETAMNTAEASVTVENGAEAAVQTAHFAPPMAQPEKPVETAPPSLGQSILDGIGSLRGQFDASAAKIENYLDAKSVDLTVRDMMSVQMQISTLTIQQDLMGKIVGKATQNVDQMLKAQ